jgi:hypothetical protein
MKSRKNRPVSMIDKETGDRYGLVSLAQARKLLSLYDKKQKANKDSSKELQFQS